MAHAETVDETASTRTSLDLRTAAEELGVHYQTAYRWVRSGRLAARRVQGKYLVDRVDLAEFERERATPEPVSTPSSARLDRSADRLRHLLVAGDDAAARLLIRRLVDDGTPIIELIQHVIAPPLREIGDAWHQGELSIWVEHRSSAIIERALGDVVPNPRGRRRGTAVVGAITGDQHALPTTMAAAALRDDQWHVHHLGADVPIDEFVAACAESGADIAVLTVTNPTLGQAAERAADTLRSTGTETIVGAPGRTLGELVELARTTSGARQR